MKKKELVSAGKFKNISGIFSVLSGKQFIGYEIHMGESYGIKNSMAGVFRRQYRRRILMIIFTAVMYMAYLMKTELQKVLCAVFTMPKDWSILEKILTERLTKNNSMIFLQMK